MKQSSSMITGPACSGSSTPPIPAPPEIWTLRAIWAQLPTVAQVSTIVPSPTLAPMLTKLGISTAPGAMKAPRRTIEPGTARKAASANSFSPQPANLEGTLSHQCAPPGPPAIASLGLSRNASSTTFFSHWWTVHSPPSFSAISAFTLSSAAIAKSTAWRTSPLVLAPIPSPSSHARSMMSCSASLIFVPQDRLEPCADIRNPDVDDRFLIAVVAALRPIVHPHGGHSERLGGGKVADHVLDHQGIRRFDAELVEQLLIAMNLRLGSQVGCEDVVEVIDHGRDAQPVEHLPCIFSIAVGMDELAAGQAGQRFDQTVVADEAVERDVVDVAHEMMRVDIVMLH